MREISEQPQTLAETIEYSFDVAKLLRNGDTIDSCIWTAQSGLNVESSTIEGTTVRGVISAASATLFEKYLVTFKITSVGNPTPTTQELSFIITIVKYNKVQVL